LHAGEVAVNNNALSGKVMDNVSSAAIPGAVVLLEQRDSNGFDRVKDAGVTDANGMFNFCPLPGTGNFDVVVDATTVSGMNTTVYGATIAFNVPPGTALGNIPLVSEGSGDGVDHTLGNHHRPGNQCGFGRGYKAGRHTLCLSRRDPHGWLSGSCDHSGI
jgi:hypothetical protein